MSQIEFHGLPVPEGRERKILYHSSFRSITTYVMPVGDLDGEFRRVLQKASGTMKDDQRAGGIEGTGALCPPIVP